MYAMDSQLAENPLIDNEPRNRRRNRTLSKLEICYVILTIVYSMVIATAVVFTFFLLVKFGATKRPHHWPIFLFVALTSLTTLIPILGIARQSQSLIYSFSTFLLLISVVVIVQFVRKQGERFVIYFEDCVIILSPVIMSLVGFCVAKQYSQSVQEALGSNFEPVVNETNV